MLLSVFEIEVLLVLLLLSHQSTELLIPSLLLVFAFIEMSVVGK